MATSPIPVVLFFNKKEGKLDHFIDQEELTKRIISSAKYVKEHFTRTDDVELVRNIDGIIQNAEILYNSIPKVNGIRDQSRKIHQQLNISKNAADSKDVEEDTGKCVAEGDPEEVDEEVEDAGKCVAEGDSEEVEEEVEEAADSKDEEVNEEVEGVNRIAEDDVELMTIEETDIPSDECATDILGRDAIFTRFPRFFKLINIISNWWTVEINGKSDGIYTGTPRTARFKGALYKKLVDQTAMDDIKQEIIMEYQSSFASNGSYPHPQGRYVPKGSYPSNPQGGYVRKGYHPPPQGGFGSKSSYPPPQGGYVRKGYYPPPQRGFVPEGSYPPPQRGFGSKGSHYPSQ